MCAAGSFKVFLRPAMVETGLNEWANFTCSLRCDLKQTFNIKWLVGFNIPRGLQTDDTKVIHEGENNCPKGAKRFRQTLRILVNSIDLDKTPVQCLALPKSNGETNHYSTYSVLRVNGKSTFTQHLYCSFKYNKLMQTILHLYRVLFNNFAVNTLQPHPIDT